MGRFVLFSGRVKGDVGKDCPSTCGKPRFLMASGPRSVLEQDGKVCMNRTYLSLTDGRLCGQVFKECGHRNSCAVVVCTEDGETGLWKTAKILLFFLQ